MEYAIEQICIGAAVTRHFRTFYCRKVVIKEKLSEY